MTPGDFSLDDKFLKEEGCIVLSGLQALVRISLDQHRADRRGGVEHDQLHFRLSWLSA